MSTVPVVAISFLSHLKNQSDSEKREQMPSELIAAAGIKSEW